MPTSVSSQRTKSKPKNQQSKARNKSETTSRPRQPETERESTTEKLVVEVDDGNAIKSDVDLDLDATAEQVQPESPEGVEQLSAASMASGSVTRVSKLDIDRSGGLKSMLPLSNRVGGAAPFVPPKSRLSRGMRVREWNRRGFVQLSSGKQKLRHRILPRTVIGIATMLMAAGVGAAFSGAAFYAYYDDRLADNERTVARFVEGFDQQFTDAAGALDDVRTESIDTIRAEMGPLADFTTDARGVVDLPEVVGDSVWLVETLDENGAISHGSAFAIVGHEGGTALITSYETISTSTESPGPAIELVKGTTRIPAKLWTWDEDRDVAMLLVDRQIPILEMAGDSAQVDAVGSRVFAMSGFGGQGATASPGVLLDHSSVGLQHTVPLGSFFRGGPLLDGNGQVLGVAAGAYNPFDLPPGQVHMAPDIRAICVEILQCSRVREVITEEVADLEGLEAGQTDDAEGAVDGQGSDGIEIDGVEVDAVEGEAVDAEAGVGEPAAEETQE